MVHRSAEQMRTASVNYMVDRKSSISDGYPAGVASPAASSDGNLAWPSAMTKIHFANCNCQ